MAQLQNNSNALELMKEGIESHIQKKIENDLIKKYMEMAEKEIRETVRPLIESATIESIEQFRSHIKAVDEVRVLLKWKEV